MADNRKGSGFVNLQRIVGANLGNRLGERVSSGIKTAAERAKSDVEGASSKFQQESQAAAVGGQPIQSRLQGILNPASSAQAKISDEDITFAKDIAEGRGYKGPTSLQDAAGISARAQSAEGLGQAARTAEGRSGLLSRFVGSPSYTSGQRNLDTILLGRTAAPQVREAAQATRGLTRQADEASVRAGNIAAQRQAEAAKLGQEFKGQVDKTREDIRQAGKTKADEFLAKEQALKSDFEKALEFNPYLREFYSYQPAAGLDFASGAASDQALAASLSDEDKAKANALARISGQAEPFSPEDFGVSSLQQGQVNLNVDAARKAYEGYRNRVNRETEAYNAEQEQRRQIAKKNGWSQERIDRQYPLRQASPMSYENFISRQQEALTNAVNTVTAAPSDLQRIKVY